MNYKIIFIISCIFIMLSLNIFAGNITGVWQTETESEFEIRLVLNQNGSGNMEWCSEDTNDSSVECSSLNFKWKYDDDFLRIQTSNGIFRYIIVQTKDYLNNKLETIVPMDSNKKSKYFNYRFYKLGNIKRFEDKWESLKPHKHKSI